MTESNETRVSVATLRGEMREGFARIDGRLETLTHAIEAANAARAAETAELRKDVDDHETRLRMQGDELAKVKAIAEKAVTPAKLWTVAASFAALVIAAVGVIVNALK